ncbi:hypothetical protein [Streptomyces sp. NPDC059639]|uniref:hypothetical protein n=1 Tax=Streptomyces sp. NPDC059639 TaxID=3346891 RepID=UPI003693418B
MVTSVGASRAQRRRYGVDVRATTPWLGLPCVTGMSFGSLADLVPNAVVAVDGTRGKVAVT